MMSIQIFQTLHLLSYVIIFISAFWLISKGHFRAAGICAVIIIILWIFNPVKVEPGKISRLETVDKFSQIPEKVEVERRSFADRQLSEMDKLKQESEEKRNEGINTN